MSSTTPGGGGGGSGTGSGAGQGVSAGVGASAATGTASGTGHDQPGEPAYLPIGTEVSAKYKGAFCEARIKSVAKNIKCRVTFKGTTGSFTIAESLIEPGTGLKTGAIIRARHPDKNDNKYHEATISKVHDYSEYTVIYDDGDVATLKRTSLCLKSGKHFAESHTLDKLPLTHPEHFGNPVHVAPAAPSRKSVRRGKKNPQDSDEELDDDDKDNAADKETVTTTESDRDTQSGDEESNKKAKEGSQATKCARTPLTTVSQRRKATNNNNNNKRESSPAVSRIQTSGDSAAAAAVTATTSTDSAESQPSSTGSAKKRKEDAPQVAKESKEVTKDKNRQEKTKEKDLDKDQEKNKAEKDKVSGGETPQSDAKRLPKSSKSQQKKKSTTTAPPPTLGATSDPPISDEQQQDNSRAAISDETDDEEEEEEGSIKSSIGSSETINVGDKLRVRYGKGKNVKVYEAKIMKMDVDPNGKPKYWVHYTGWNTRYDEWIQKPRIVEVIPERGHKKTNKDKTPSLSAGAASDSNQSENEASESTLNKLNRSSSTIVLSSPSSSRNVTPPPSTLATATAPVTTIITTGIVSSGHQRSPSPISSALAQDTAKSDEPVPSPRNQKRKNVTAAATKISSKKRRPQREADEVQPDESSSTAGGEIQSTDTTSSVSAKSSSNAVDTAEVVPPKKKDQSQDTAQTSSRSKDKLTEKESQQSETASEPQVTSSSSKRETPSRPSSLDIRSHAEDNSNTTARGASKTSSADSDSQSSFTNRTPSVRSSKYSSRTSKTAKEDSPAPSEGSVVLGKSGRGDVTTNKSQKDHKKTAEEPVKDSVPRAGSQETTEDRSKPTSKVSSKSVPERKNSARNNSSKKIRQSEPESPAAQIPPPAASQPVSSAATPVALPKKRAQRGPTESDEEVKMLFEETNKLQEEKDREKTTSKPSSAERDPPQISAFSAIHVPLVSAAGDEEEEGELICEEAVPASPTPPPEGLVGVLAAASKIPSPADGDVEVPPSHHDQDLDTGDQQVQAGDLLSSTLSMSEDSCSSSKKATRESNNIKKNKKRGGGGGSSGGRMRNPSFSESFTEEPSPAGRQATKDTKDTMKDKDRERGGGRGKQSRVSKRTRHFDPSEPPMMSSTVSSHHHHHRLSPPYSPYPIAPLPTTFPYNPVSEYNFLEPLNENATPDGRISDLQNRISNLRKTYYQLKTDLAALDRRRKRSRARTAKQADKDKEKDKEKDKSSAPSTPLAAAAATDDQQQQSTNATSEA